MTGTGDPVGLGLRRVIFERFNDPDARFTNDELLEALAGDAGPPCSIDDLEPHVRRLCDAGLVRDIAQNFTTIHLKLFDTVERLRCGSCGRDVHMGRSEERACPACGGAP